MISYFHMIPSSVNDLANPGYMILYVAHLHGFFGDKSHGFPIFHDKKKLAASLRARSGLHFEGREAGFVRSFACFVMGLFNLVFRTHWCLMLQGS